MVFLIAISIISWIVRVGHHEIITVVSDWVGNGDIYQPDQNGDDNSKTAIHNSDKFLDYITMVIENGWFMLVLCLILFSGHAARLAGQSIRLLMGNHLRMFLCHM